MPPLIPHSENVSNSNPVVPDSGPNIAETTSQSKVLAAHLPTLPPIIIRETKIILSTESAMPTSEPPQQAEPGDRTATPNPGMQIDSEHSNSELDGRLPTTTEDIFHIEMMPASETPPAPMDRTTTANLSMQVGHSDSDRDGELDGQRLGVTVLLSEGMPIGFSHPNSPVPTTRETDSHIQTTLTVCELPQINSNKVKQTGFVGGDRALTPPTCTESVDMAQYINMASNLGPDDGEQFGPNPAEVVLEISSDIISSKGKRKMIDCGDDTDPAGEGEFKRHRITTEAEEDSDIEYIGSPASLQTKKQTAMKMEDSSLPIKFMTTDSDVSVKLEMKIKDEPDRKITINEMMASIFLCYILLPQLIDCREIMTNWKTEEKS